MTVTLRENYIQALKRLPILRPTPDDVAQFCPYLPRDIIENFLAEGGYLTCPPLRVQDAFQIISYDKDTGWLNYNFASRLQDSWLQAYDKEAVKFANDYWPAELIEDNWDDILTLSIQDPTDLNQNGSPKTKTNLYVCFNRPFGALMADLTEPTSVLMDKAICVMSLDSFVYRELKGSRGGYADNCCAYCGHGLSLDGCRGCGHKFTDNGTRHGWGTPLSQMMVGFLQEHGFTFKQGPEIAWKLEAEKYKEQIERITARIEL